MDTPKHVQTELWALDRLIPYENNAKKHTPEKIDQIAAWILARGWTQPILVQRSTGSIIAGHGRRLAAIKLNLKNVPVIPLDVDDGEARKMRLADNALVSTDYDIQKMQNEIFELKNLGFEIDNLGFSIKELDFLNETIVQFDDEAFIDDITVAVETQKTENVKKQAETDGQDTPLSKIFGFKRLTIAQGRKVRSFMSFIEQETGKNGAEALMTHIQQLGL